MSLLRLQQASVCTATSPLGVSKKQAKHVPLFLSNIKYLDIGGSHNDNYTEDFFILL